MPDIRPQLRQRLREIAAHRRELQERFEAQMTALERHETKIQALLEAEDALLVSSRQDIKAPTVVPNKTLRDYVLGALADGEPRPLKELKNLARQAAWPIDEASSGRAINFTLVGLQRGGRVERLTTGEWRLKQDAPPAQAGEAS